MNKFVHTQRPKGPRDVASFLRKLWKLQRMVVQAIAFLEWLLRLFDGN
jgi:hypothetical protein